MTNEQELKLYREKYKDEMRLNNSIVYRQDGKKWTLPKVITLGERSFSNVSYLYKVIGFQKPLKGEYYLSGAKIEAYKAANDLTTSYIVIEIIDSI